jgi:hypothetical protein
MFVLRRRISKEAQRHQDNSTKAKLAKLRDFRT